MDWNPGATLDDLSPDHVLTIERKGRPVLYARVRELTAEARLPGSLTLEQVKLAFSGDARA